MLLLSTLHYPLSTAVYAADSASLQFTVAAPDPVMAGEEVKFQTLIVNTSTATWQKGSYYWVAEIYYLEEEEKKFFAKTDSVTPPEDVPSGSAHGVQIPFVIPENFTGKRLLYRTFLIKDGRILLETDYKGFKVIEKEFKPPPPTDFKVGGDVTFSYKNASSNGWDNHQAITALNAVGKVKNSSFLFNTYLIHTRHKPINVNIILLNYYAPWGTLGVGDISPVLTPLSLDGQGMRGVSFDRQRTKYSLTGIFGRIVAPEEPSSVSAGRFARYTGGVKYTYNLLSSLKISGDMVFSKDDEYSITIDTDTSTLVPQQNIVYGTNLEWAFMKNWTLVGDYQMSSFRKDLDSGESPEKGSGWKQELKYKGRFMGFKGFVSRIDSKFMSFASPSIIADRFTYNGEINLFPVNWLSLSAGYDWYEDNLENDPSKTTTEQTKMNFSNGIKLFNATMLNASYVTNAVVGKPSSVQDNKTTSMNFSVTQPIKAHNLNFGYQISKFEDKTKLSDDLDTNLISINGAFKISQRLSMSSGFVNSVSKNKVDSSSNKNNSITSNFTYIMPKRYLAVQAWTTVTTNKNDSPTYPSDNKSFSANGEVIWLKSQKFRWTFGLGLTSRKDNLNSENDTDEINVLTRVNYSF